jgi:hypothetical protein
MMQNPKWDERSTASYSTNENSANSPVIVDRLHSYSLVVFHFIDFTNTRIIKNVFMFNEKWKRMMNLQANNEHDNMEDLQTLLRDLIDALTAKFLINLDLLVRKLYRDEMQKMSLTKAVTTSSVENSDVDWSGQTFNIEGVYKINTKKKWRKYLINILWLLFHLRVRTRNKEASKAINKIM